MSTASSPSRHIARHLTFPQNGAEVLRDLFYKEDGQWHFYSDVKRLNVDDLNELYEIAHKRDRCDGTENPPRHPNTTIHIPGHRPAWYEQEKASLRQVSQ